MEERSRSVRENAYQREEIFLYNGVLLLSTP
jgi:hypothetical protein